ncbi:hypothetical protein NMG29_39170 [Streptomyces cocklensis]|uniref:Uncharacterized protein n=1 Tax=Actinacidiphila cocklensis TaxID=887465 RepID=A0A9W4EAQ0_9ACTN|nr:hypothetical protein [Actinacidiphila cocklensis]MDD1064105.1 hypothetical protein [Actinacidiphila cocklensis]CAG6397620.1 conserved hypothetical protein [Actinacidiphila cocklensis]
MVGDRTSSAPAPDCSYADAAVYVDAEGSSRVIARLQDLMGVQGAEQHLTVGPVRVYGARNGHATGRKAHPFDFLEWPTVLECEASAAPAADVVEAVAAVLEALWRGGFKALAACDFEDELPACGGIARYPLPPAPEGARVSLGSWWRNLLFLRKRED